MRRSVMLILSAAATALLLVMGVGVYWAVQTVLEQPTAVAQAGTQAQTQTAPGDAGESADASAIAQYQEREGRYQQLITEANAKIMQANADNKTLARKLSEAQTALTTAANRPQPDAVVAQPYPVTPDMAARLAQSLAKGAALKRDPELVTYQNQVAYKVTLEAGVVMIDANTDALLYAGRRDPEGGSE